MSDNDKLDAVPPVGAPAIPPAGGRIDWGHILRAFKHRNYALFFAGQGVSLIGTWMQQQALLWLVYEITKRRSAMGELTFYSQLPSLPLFLIAGVLGDRWNRHRMLVVLQVLAALQALALAAVTYWGGVQFWHLVVLGMAAGIIRSFEIPIRQGFVVQMLDDPRDLPGAIAMNSFLINASFVIGPTLGGLLIHLSGDKAAPCFLINAISFIAVIVALLAMKVAKSRPVARGESPLRTLWEGLKYTALHKQIRGSILFVAFTSFVAMQYATLMPVFAGGNARVQGYLLSAAGAGAMIGALFIASQKSPERLHKLITGGALVFGVGLALFAYSRFLWLSLPLLVLAGVGRMIQMASANTYVQTLVDDDKRTRVMAFHAMAFMGVAPFGALYLGLIASTAMRAEGAVLLAGLACVGGAIAFAGRLPKAHRREEAHRET